MNIDFKTVKIGSTTIRYPSDFYGLVTITRPKYKKFGPTDKSLEGHETSIAIGQQTMEIQFSVLEEFVSMLVRQVMINTASDASPKELLGINTPIILVSKKS